MQLESIQANSDFASKVAPAQGWKMMRKAQANERTDEMEVFLVENMIAGSSEVSESLQNEKFMFDQISRAP